MMKPHRRSPLALAILALLIEAPMHPYRMQQLLKSRGKDDVINIRQRGSLYQTIDRLVREGLIEAASVERNEGRPDRTVYTITALGQQVGVDWLRAMIAETHDDYPEFPVALSFVMLLPAHEVLALLEARLELMIGREKKLEADIETVSSFLSRVSLLETEYMLAIARAERQWVEALIPDLRDGALDWTIEELKALAARLEGEPSDPT